MNMIDYNLQSTSMDMVCPGMNLSHRMTPLFTLGRKNYTLIAETTGRLITSILPIMLITVLTAAAHAQPVWEVQNPSPMQLNCLAVQCVDSSTGYILTVDGYIMKTTDRGSTWQKIFIGTTNTITSFSFPTKDTGYVVGDNGLFLKTTDGCNTWQHVNLDSTGLIRYVSFANAQLGYALYSYGLLTTTNGGLTWSFQGLPCDAQDYCYSIISCNGNNVFLSGDYGEILYSSNEGNKWQVNYIDGIVQDVEFIAGIDSLLFAVGTLAFGDNVYIVHIIILNDTAFYYDENMPSELIQYINGVGFINRDTGYIIGNQGVMLKTTDGSSTWIIDSNKTNNNLNKISFGSENWGLCIGTNVILQTIDGGNHWSNIITNGLTTNLYGVSFYNSLVGTAVGDSGIILYTTNGGEQWKQQFSNTINHLSGVSQIDSLDAVVVGDTGVLLRTSDGGNNWAQEINGINNNITALSFRNNLQGIALGNSGLVLLTTDGGHYWLQTKQPYGTNYTVLYATDSILYSGCSSLIKSTDGGKTWESFTNNYWNGTDGGSSSVSIIAKDSLHLYICGSYSWAKYQPYTPFNFPVIFYSSNGGIDWFSFYTGASQEDYEHAINMQYSGFIYDTICIAFDNANNVYSNERTSWLISPNPVPNQINALTVVDDSVLYAVGNGGSIIKLVGFEQAPVAVKEHIPNPVNFSLFQNYPNPVTSNQTTINYDLINEGQVMLKVYTLLGEEVAAPVAGWQSSGAHSVIFDASRLPDGVYFYRLETKGAAQTKMLVVGR